ncbi:MAG: insulinase family protein, partial [Waddliaceae bacterium]
MVAKIAFDRVEKKYKQFKITRIVDLSGIKCTLRELVHIPTGAQVMHIKNDDSENVFCLSFQTVLDSSNGVAHILEHSVLCGSEKFPVKDPFFAMTRRSLNTFMNAFTGADFTCYPAASQVSKDFYNLLEVYLDAVFKPNLRELSFMQEGHHLEFANPADPSTPLEFKGVVFNEMKGAMSTPDSRLSEALDETLFPDITYGYNSGGDPKIIPQLTYQQLLDFHAQYYHPSRCLFFFYGNLPLEGHLDFIEEHVLKGVKKKESLPTISDQSRFTAPRRKTVGYPFPAEDDPHEKTLITFSWLTCHILEQEELLALNILSLVLLS